MIAHILSKQLWADIATLIQRESGNDEVTRGVVVKVDAANHNVFVKEFGETPIPICGFDQNVTYYDSTAASGVVRKTALVEIAMPKVGDLIVILKQGGQRRLPLCIGIVKGKNYIGV